MISREQQASGLRRQRNSQTGLSVSRTMNRRSQTGISKGPLNEINEAVNNFYDKSLGAKFDKFHNQADHCKKLAEIHSRNAGHMTHDHGTRRQHLNSTLSSNRSILS